MNCEIEQSDAGKGIPNLCEAGVVDNSTAYPPAAVIKALDWACKAVAKGPIYVHCHMGGGRAPAFAYGILRVAMGMGPQEALDAIRGGKNWRYSWRGQVVGGSIGEWPGLEWGQPPLASAKTLAMMDRIVSGKAEVGNP